MLREFFVQLPLIGQFAFIFSLLILFPRIAERVGLPGVLGLIGGGILLGPEVLGIVNTQGHVVTLFSELGKLLLMFYAGHEIDLERFKAVGGRALLYGVLTCALPLALGGLVATAFGYELNAAILIGSLLASHTLLGLPIVQKLGVSQLDAVVVTVGATIVTDISAMLILAICVSIHHTGFSMTELEVKLAELAIYVPAVVFGLSSLARGILRRFHLSADLRFALLMLMIAIAALAAEEIELEGIVGAFLVGIAVRRAVPDDEPSEALYAISHGLFIPEFFLSVGLLVNSKVLLETLLHDFPFVAAIVGGLLLGKLAAATAFGWLTRMPTDQRLLMWSLSVPQVAATLAAALVGYNAVNAAGVRLLDDRVLNAMVVLVVVTAVAGPMATRRVGLRLRGPEGPGPAAVSEPAPAAAG